MKTLLFSLLACCLPGWGHSKDLRLDPVLFHSGSRPGMEENIAIGNVPEKVWKEFIFGRTNFDLPPYRKGLYGAEALAGTSLYSLYRTLAGEQPWLMMIHLAPGCRSGDALFPADYSVSFDPADPSRFSRWYRNRRERYRHLEKECLRAYGDRHAWEEGAPYELGAADPETRRLTALCTPVLEDFLNEEKIRLVLDTVNNDSWYIRDPACVERVTGSAAQLRDSIFHGAIGDPQERWMKNFFGDASEPGSFFAGNSLLLISILGEAPLGAVQDPELRKIGQELAEWIGDERLEEARLSLDANAHNPEILRRLLQRARQLLAQPGKLSSWQAGLRSWSGQVRERLGRECRGKRGVPPERRERCGRATRELTQALLKLLR